MYISSPGIRVLWLCIASVLLSFTPKVRFWPAANSCILRINPSAVSYFRSFSKTESGMWTSVKPRSSCRMLSTRSLPSSVGFILTTVCSPRSSSRYLAMRSISSGGQPCIVERVTLLVSWEGIGRLANWGNCVLQDGLDLGELRGGVGHLVHEAGHARGLDAFQVVAHAHVEDACRTGVSSHPSRRRRTWIAAHALMYSWADSSSLSSCDHSTL